MKKTTVSLVEDSGTLRRGLAVLLNDAPDLQCRSVCASAEEALQSLLFDARLAKRGLMFRAPSLAALEKLICWIDLNLPLWPDYMNRDHRAGAP